MGGLLKLKNTPYRTKDIHKGVICTHMVDFCRPGHICSPHAKPQIVVHSNVNASTLADHQKFILQPNIDQPEITLL